ncbi:SusD family protein [Pedobacter steynii]|uniref:SusD family protein n=2 Tax=Pedobacter steynii TaxID=430522 RepID=A0A1G9NVC6_9SPHI|nr:SusD family protein [Pedobacter steynii]
MFCCSMALSACKKFLDVQPQDRFLSEQVFKDEKTINAALNGIYLNMAKSDLYGSRLSMRDLDLMAQYYNTSSNASYRLYTSYNYAESGMRADFSKVWQSAYRVILNANSFIGQLEKSQNVIDDSRKHILMGEAYAIRAYLHFDMLRLFGPVYARDSLKNAIPCLLAVTDQIQPILPANKVIDSVLKDLNLAAALLQNDPVRKEGVVVQTDADPGSNFYKMRNRRFNYYAVQAIKARVLLYRGNKAGALSLARAVITEGGKYFPWSPEAVSQPNTANPDRVFSSEVLLGFQNIELYNQQRDFFAAPLQNDVILAPLQDRLDEIYENLPNDYRFRVNWRDGGSAGKTYKTFVKYEEVTDQAKTFRNFQSLFRLSELYYIIAECEIDNDLAVKALNVLRSSRGLPALISTANVPAELYKEYRKEFWGEGQTFFFFKRKMLMTIPSGSVNGLTVNMRLEDYVVPLPLIETQSR